MPLQITFYDNEIANYLRVDPEQEKTTIDSLKVAAMDEAEQFLNTDFSANEAPASVKGWVLNRIAEKFEGRGQEPQPNFYAIKSFRVYPFRG